MKKILIFFVFLFASSILYSQNNEDIDAGSFAVLIRTASSEGSGFYIKDTTRNFMCLVTACHVIIDMQQNKLLSDSVLFISYKKNSQINDRDSFRISLAAAYKSGMLQYNLQDDIAVIKFAKTNGRALNYLPFITKISNSSTYLNASDVDQFIKLNDLKTMVDIFTVGYPKSLSLSINFDYNRPLIRKGIIAGIDLQKNRIVIDCPTYQGNSGGIVFTIDFKGELSIVGLISQFVPFEERWINEAYRYYNTNIYNSGYSIVIPSNSIINQINLLK